MARKEYLSSDKRSRFDSPPQLENIRILIEIPIWVDNYLKTVFTSTNIVGFILQMGYLRVTTRFQNPNLFYEHYISLVVDKFKLDPNDIGMILCPQSNQFSPPRGYS